MNISEVQTNRPLHLPLDLINLNILPCQFHSDKNSKNTLQLKNSSINQNESKIKVQLKNNAKFIKPTNLSKDRSSYTVNPLLLNVLKNSAAHFTSGESLNINKRIPYVQSSSNLNQQTIHNFCDSTNDFQTSTLAKNFQEDKTTCTTTLDSKTGSELSSKKLISFDLDFPYTSTSKQHEPNADNLEHVNVSQNINALDSKCSSFNQSSLFTHSKSLSPSGIIKAQDLHPHSKLELSTTKIGYPKPAFKYTSNESTAFNETDSLSIAATDLKLPEDTRMGPKNSVQCEEMPCTSDSLKENIYSDVKIDENKCTTEYKSRKRKGKRARKRHKPNRHCESEKPYGSTESTRHHSKLYTSVNSDGTARDRRNVNTQARPLILGLPYAPANDQSRIQEHDSNLEVKSANCSPLRLSAKHSRINRTAILHPLESLKNASLVNAEVKASTQLETGNHGNSQHGENPASENSDRCSSANKSLNFRNRLVKIFLSEKQSRDLRESGRCFPGAPPATPLPDFYQRYEHVPCMSDIKAQRRLKCELGVIEQAEYEKNERRKLAELKAQKLKVKSDEKELKIKQRRLIYKLNETMTKLENSQFQEFCKAQGFNKKSQFDSKR